jgi:hypothetical protein
VLSTAPIAPLFPTTSVPALNVKLLVEPPKVLLPFKIKVPLPDLVSE